MAVDGSVRIAYVTTCRNRLQHLKLTLPPNLGAIERFDEQAVYVLDHCCTQGTTDWLLTNFRPEIAAGKLVVFTNRQNVPWHMGHAKNCVTRLAIRDGATAFYNMDADNFIGPVLPSRVRELFGEGRRGAVLHAAFAMNVGGRVGTDARDFFKVGGYDEELRFGWGVEDEDFKRRCMALGMREELEDGEALYLHHDETSRVAEQRCSTTKSSQMNLKVVQRKRRARKFVANLGVPYGCVRATRNGGETEVVIDDWPKPR